MLRRRSHAESQSYFDLHPTEIKKSNPYLVKFQAMKQACNSPPVKANKRHFPRKTSSQCEQHRSKQYMDSAQLFTTSYQYGMSSELSSPYLRKKTKQIQYSWASSSQFQPETWGQNPYPHKQELPHSTISHLSQFIDYYLQNSLVRAEWNKNSQLEMQTNPLYILQTQIQAARLELQKQSNQLIQIKNETSETELKTKDEIRQLEHEIQIGNIEILQLINQHVQHRNLLKKITALQKQISQTKIKQNLRLQHIQADIRAQIQAHNQSNIKLVSNIEKSQHEMSVIMQLRQNVKSIREMIADSRKIKDEQEVIYKQLIKEKSGKDIKEDLTSNVRFQGTLLSNKQILDNFYKSIDVKQQIIKNAVITHSENHQFQTSLQLKQTEQQINMTRSKNCFNQNEAAFIATNKSQFDVYEAYLRTDLQVKRTEAHLDMLYEKYQRGLNQMAAEVENIKTAAADQLKKMRELENIEAIRQAEIQQLSEILNSKKEQLSKFKTQKSSFDIFRSSIM